ARIAVKRLLKPSGNVLVIRFESALRRGKEREATYDKRPAWNGNPSRVYVRKAQYHYGWDWGPTLLTAGLWRPVYLEAYSNRIVDVAINPQISEDLAEAVLYGAITLREPNENHDLHFEVFDPTGKLSSSYDIQVN